MFSLIQGFMSCGLLKISHIRGMFVMMFLGHPLFMVSKNSSSGWTFCVLSGEVTLLLSRLVLAACGNFSALSAQMLFGFSDAVTGDGDAMSGTAIAEGRGQSCLQVHAGF